MSIGTDIKEYLPLDVMSADINLRTFVRILSLFPVINNTSTPFHAFISVYDEDKIFIGINLEKFKKLNTLEQIFLISHEVSHIILSHLGRGFNMKYPKLYNIATDAKINDLLSKEYKYSMSPLRDSGGKLFGVFLDDLKDQGIIPTDIANNNLKAEDIYQLLVDKLVKHNESMINSLDNGRLDSHDSSINNNMGDKLNARIKEILKQARDSKEAGSITGNFLRDLMGSFKTNFPFEQILNRYINTDRMDFSRQHRRYRMADIYIPRYHNTRFVVYAGVDVSQSCFDFQEQFLSYLKTLPSFEQVDYIDTEIKYTIKAGETLPTKLEAGGGTDLRLLFKKWSDIEKNNTGMTLNFVLLTDGLIIEPIKIGPSVSDVFILTLDKEIINPNILGKRYINIKIT